MCNVPQNEHSLTALKMLLTDGDYFNLLPAISNHGFEDVAGVDSFTWPVTDQRRDDMARCST